MYAFLDPMWVRCLFILFVTIMIIWLFEIMEDMGLLTAIFQLLLFCLATSAFVGFVAFLLKGI